MKWIKKFIEELPQSAALIGFLIAVVLVFLLVQFIKIHPGWYFGALAASIIYFIILKLLKK